MNDQGLRQEKLEEKGQEGQTSFMKGSYQKICCEHLRREH